MINNRALNYIRVAVKDAEEKFHCKLKWGCFVVGDCLVMSLRSKKEEAIRSLAYRLSNNLYKNYGYHFCLDGSPYYSEGFYLIEGLKIPIDKLDHCIGMVDGLFGRKWLIFCGVEHREFLNPNYGVLDSNGVSDNRKRVLSCLELDDSSSYVSFKRYAYAYKKLYGSDLFVVDDSIDNRYFYNKRERKKCLAMKY